MGDAVALEPGVPCRMCTHCKTGSYNLCPDIRFFATPPVHGSLAQHVVHAADFTFKIPDGVSLEEVKRLDFVHCPAYPLTVWTHIIVRDG